MRLIENWGYSQNRHYLVRANESNPTAWELDNVSLKRKLSETIV